MSLERSDTHGTKPTLALAMGDPAGISPELTARLLALDEVRQQARLIVIGDRRVLEQGARVAAVDPDVETIGPGDPLPNRIDRPVFVDLANLAPETVARGVATRARAPIDRWRDADGGICAPPHRGCGPQSACGRRRKFRARGDRRDRPRDRAGATGRHRGRRALFARYGVPAGEGRRLRRGSDHVSRPGPDRDEAHGLRSRRHAAGRIPLPDLHARAWHRL